MQTFTTKTSAIEYATATHKWTQADAKRAYEQLTISAQVPQDELALLRAMAAFAGPALLERQRLQAAQKAQVTIKNRRIDDLSESYTQMVQDYEHQIKRDRSNFIRLIQTVYGIAQKFGFKDPWIDALLATYDNYINPDQGEINPDQDEAA